MKPTLAASGETYRLQTVCNSIVCFSFDSLYIIKVTVKKK